jgi:hypothetical protein
VGKAGDYHKLPKNGNGKRNDKPLKNNRKIIKK